MTTIEPLLFSLWKDLHDIRILWQVGVIALSVLLAASASRLLATRIRAAASSRWEISLGGLRRLVFPLAALALLLIARGLLAPYQSVSLLNVAVPLLTAMAVIRILAYMLQLVFAPGGVLSVFERTIGWLVWIAVALHILGLTPGLIEYFDDVNFHIGKQRISLLLIGQAMLWVVVTLLLALWAGRVIEERLMSAQGMDMTMRVMLTKVVRAVLVLCAILVVLPAVGIDLTVLSVLGGAIGVGIGFGLQKIASNYISGFIILMDRSVTIGNFISIEKYSGQLTKMTARYVVIRNADNTEIIVPNETVITSSVVNHSYSDMSVRVAIPVQISYRSDLDLAMRILVEAAQAQPRALKAPEPKVLIKEFAESGINLELGVWVDDPEAGQANLRSDIYHSMWREFRTQGIEIPYPQREVRLLGAAAHGT